MKHKCSHECKYRGTHLYCDYYGKDLVNPHIECSHYEEREVAWPEDDVEFLLRAFGADARIKAAHEEMVREMARDFDKESGGTMKPKSTHLSHVSGTPMPPGKTTANVNPHDPPVEIQVERPTTLLSLCRRDPEWAARRIGELVEAGEKARKRIQYLRGELRNMGWWDTSEETEDE